MANPQTENGFTRIANELLEELIRYKFPKNTGSVPYRICFFIIRKTYGYQKKEDRISLTQFEKGLGVSRPVISYWLNYLVVAKLLVVDKTANKVGFNYKLNKNYDEWLPLGNSLLLVAGRKFTSKVATTETSKVATTHKRKKEMTKENIANDKHLHEDIVHVIETFSKLNPACSRMYGNKTQRQASEDLLETYGKERIISIIENTLPKTNSIKFFPTITTPVQLRDKFIMLESAIIRYKKEQPKNKVAFS